MNKLEFLNKFIQNYLKEYKKNFDKITKESIGFDSITTEYINWNKYSDHWPIQNRYSDYDFLSHLDEFERDKIIFLYSLERYIIYIMEIEDKRLNKEYLLYLEFNLDNDFFSDKIVTLFPDINYYFSNKDNGKIEKIKWHEWIKFWKYWDKWRDYIKKIVIDLGLAEYFDFIDYYFNAWYWDEYIMSIDFNFDISENKKRLKEYFYN